ncbi:type III-B CRISPR module-associated protein Cmr5 [Thermococcus henrietii]|uniref:type III-B CRISPR module-associated protein Cmr5 n=1 Tax=Thermococcus henrietii TaxID=2016361 RepID=UPI000C06A469|nr:type III-B CRISPR module-associated protein Cmr5 [Thermococcus henrietii]
MDFRTLEQERAKFAYEKVSEVRREDEDTQGRYVSYVKSAPVLILTNGLGQALAFYLSKLDKPINVDYKAINPKGFPKGDKMAYAYLYRHIAEWLAKRVTNGEDPLKYYMEHDGMSAIRLTDETIALLSWLKRFADAMLRKEKEQR